MTRRHTHEPFRARGFTVFSKEFTPTHIHNFIASHPRAKTIGAAPPPNSPAPGGWVFFYDTGTRRTVAAVARMFPVNTTVTPRLVTPDGDLPTGKFALARAGRFLTEHYPTSAIMASFDWEEELAALETYEQRAPQHDRTKQLINRLNLELLGGTMTLRQIFEEYPELYIANHVMFRRFEADGRRFAKERAQHGTTGQPAIDIKR